MAQQYNKQPAAGFGDLRNLRQPPLRSTVNQSVNKLRQAGLLSAGSDSDYVQTLGSLSWNEAHLDRIVKYILGMGSVISSDRIRGIARLLRPDEASASFGCDHCQETGYRQIFRGGYSAVVPCECRQSPQQELALA